MKLAGGRVEAFLRRPDAAVRAVLIYGTDRGLARERADALVRAVLGEPPDPFRVCELSMAMLKDDPVRLADEMASLSLGGGRRVIRLRDAGDAAAGPAGSALNLAFDGALLIVEAGDLGKRSALRTLFEAAAAAAAIPCYGDDDAGVERVVAGMLAAAGLTATPEAAAYLAGNLGGDRAMTRGAIDKLIVYMGGPGIVALDDARACVGDSREASLDAVVMAAGGGELAALDRALDAAFAAGVQPVSVIRAAARHVQRLHLAATMMATGRSAAEAMATLRPPVFYNQQAEVRAQLSAWSPERLADVIGLLIEAELDCKVTGAPAEALCARTLWQMAQSARRRGGGRSVA